MKHKFFITGILTVFVVFLMSCNKEEFYSCDSKADQWVKSNFTEIRVMTRSDWNKINDIVYQRAAYNAFSEEQRVDLWLNKFEEVLTFEWTDEECSHLQLLINTLKNNTQWLGNGEVEEYRDQMDLFFHKWINDAKILLNWDDLTIYALIGTPETIIQNKNGSMIIKTFVSPNVKTGGEGYGDICNCGNDSDIFMCPIFEGYSCVNDKCEVTMHGCGKLWMDVCWGKCKK